MYNPELILPFILIGFLCVIHVLLTIKKTRSETKLKQDEQYILQKEVAVQEETYQKISAEIHDNITLTLSLSRLYLNDISPVESHDVNNKINLSSSLIRKAIDDLNDLSKSLSSEAIEKFGLVRSVEEQVNDVKKVGVFGIHFEVNGVARSIGSYKELILFRMIQESLNNIIRHANATSVTVSLSFDETTLHIEIRDNGVGFRTGETKPSCRGTGLKNMRKRAELLRAQLYIESLPRAGTIVKIIVPVNEKSQKECT